MVVSLKNSLPCCREYKYGWTVDLPYTCFFFLLGNVLVRNKNVNNLIFFNTQIRYYNKLQFSRYIGFISYMNCLLKTVLMFYSFEDNITLSYVHHFFKESRRHPEKKNA